MKAVKNGDIVVLKKGQLVKLPFCYGSKKDASVLFKKGAIGKILGISSNHDEVEAITIEFNVCYGVGIRVDVSPDCVESASSEQVSCYCGYNCQ